MDYEPKEKWDFEFPARSVLSVAAFAALGARIGWEAIDGVIFLLAALAQVLML